MTRSGNQLLLNGQPYFFSGLNIYNANSSGNCWYDLASGSGLDDSLTAIGPGKKVFRAWFFQFFATTNGQRDWTAFDHTLAVAHNHGVKVIPTLTNQWGDCEPPTGFKDETWYQSAYQSPDPSGTVSYRDWVQEVVTRYKNDPTILAWQLVNEAEVKPSASGGCSTNAATILTSFASDVSALIKSIDSNHLVSLGTIGGGQCGAQGAEYQDVHSVPTIDLCEYHDYGQPNAPIPGDQWNGLQVRLDQCNALNKPLFVGETGIIPTDVGGTLQQRADAFAAKFRAQFGAGVAGELVWAWSALGSTVDNYDVGPGDPVLSVLDAYPGEPYPHPVGASPLRVSLVPAFKPCENAGADSGHGSPLDFASCSGPKPSSSTVTLGPNALGFARMVVCASSSSAPFCNPAGGLMPKPDVRFTGSIRDVKCAQALPASQLACPGPGVDYNPNTATGPYSNAGGGTNGAMPACLPSAASSTDCIAGTDLTEIAEIPNAQTNGQSTSFEGSGLRVTDSASGTGQNTFGTVVDIGFPIPIDCIPVSGSAGSTCGVNTTANALYPGSVLGGKAAVWQIGQIELEDSGPDGVSRNADDELFATQGVFLP